jgi:hypothetical protein
LPRCKVTNISYPGYLSPPARDRISSTRSPVGYPGRDRRGSPATTAIASENGRTRIAR